MGTRIAITKKGLRAYLESLPPDLIVGRPSETEDCLLCRYAHTLGATTATFDLKKYELNNQSRNCPRWMEEAQKRWMTVGATIRAPEALKLLKK